MEMPGFSAEEVSSCDDGLFFMGSPVGSRFLVQTTYSFAEEVENRLFDTKKLAIQFLTADFRNEVRIDTEENGYKITARFSDDLTHAEIDHDGDKTEWNLYEIGPEDINRVLEVKEAK
jgi:hypothetical protein